MPGRHFRSRGLSCSLGELPTQATLLPRIDRGRTRPQEVMRFLCVHTKSWSSSTRPRRTHRSPVLGDVLNVVRKDGGKVEKVDIWGKRRLAYEIAKHAEGIYVVIDVKAAPATVSELDRQLSLNESVLRTKVMRTDKH